VGHDCPDVVVARPVVGVGAVVVDVVEGVAVVDSVDPESVAWSLAEVVDVELATPDVDVTDPDPPVAVVAAAECAAGSEATSTPSPTAAAVAAAPVSAVSRRTRILATSRADRGR
jgi:hypothetical protein